MAQVLIPVFDEEGRHVEDVHEFIVKGAVYVIRPEKKSHLLQQVAFRSGSLRDPFFEQYVCPTNQE